MEQVAAAMRQNANALDQAMPTARQHEGAADAIQRLTMRGQFAKLRADNERAPALGVQAALRQPLATAAADGE